MQTGAAFRWWLVWCLLYLAAVTLTLGLGTPYPGDEPRFIETSKSFGRGVSLDLLRHYPEMSGPLPFLIHGLWGRGFGYSLGAMRCGSLLIGLAALLLLFEFLRQVLAQPRAALLAGIGLCLNPYMATMSLFVYTDMPTLLFCLAALVAGLRGLHFTAAAALAAAMLSRQYTVFLALGMGAYFLLVWIWRRDRASASMAAACALSPLPLLALMALWGGPAPDSWMRREYMTAGAAFQLSSFTGYLAQLPFYLLPFVIAARRRIRITAALALATGLYWLFPIRVPAASHKIGLTTVGLLDRAVSDVLPSPLWRDGFYWIGFGLGLWILATMLTDARRCVARREPGYAVLALLVTLAFLVVMPWSYLYWEKYLLPVLPVVAAHLTAARGRI